MIKKFILGFIIIFVVGLFFFIQTPDWFFFITGQSKIDFNSLSGKYEANQRIAFFEGNNIPVPMERSIIPYTSILGESTASDKRIEIDLSNQKLYAYEGANKIHEFLISTGKPWFSTPVGEFRGWIKLRYTRMKGVGYDLPNVPYTVFFYNDQIPKWKGYGLHGTYWHSNFGHPMSHGCVNMKTEEIEQLFHWIDLPTPEELKSKFNSAISGTRIMIYGTTPTN